jgi:hypothetical protein
MSESSIYSSSADDVALALCELVERVFSDKELADKTFTRFPAMQRLYADKYRQWQKMQQSEQ